MSRSPQKKYQQSWKDKDINVRRVRQAKKNKRFSIKKIIFNKKTLMVFVFLFFVGIFSVIGVVAWMSRDLPNPNQLLDRDIAQSTKIYDRTGKILLYEIHGEEQRTLMTLDKIPDYAEDATIAIEDKNFYHHGGFSIVAIIRTAITDILHGKKAGASTITQQLVKNSILTSRKTIERKIKEIILAYRIEKKFTKSEILQMYLNEIPYGSTAYGIEAASRHYFGKSCTDLTIAESATLAALPQAPSYYSPYGSHKKLLLGRKDYILKLMHEQGYITDKEFQDALKQKIVFKEPSRNIKAPHFVMYIKSELAKKYGQKMVEQGGLTIITTLDMYKQKIAEDVIRDRAKINLKNYDASNAALVAMDTKTGQILAMVGSKDYFSDKIDGKFNVAIAKRQPGSSIKPMIYASLFEKGYTPDTKLFDVVTNFSNSDKPYEPKNYDLKEHGLISIRKALAGSLNIPAVKALYLTSVKDASEFASRVGYTTLSDYKRLGLSMVLGGGEVKLLEHVNAYSTFARDGIKHPIVSILKVKDPKGRILEEYKPEEKRVFDKEVARKINSILSDNNARAFTYGIDNWLTLGDRPVCAKTGTTNSYRDAWTIGYTPSLVAGVWVGNNDNSRMRRGAAGGSVAGPIWNAFMKKVLGDTPFEQFKKPKDFKTGKPAIDGDIKYEKTVKIDSISGLLATDQTPEQYIKTVVFPQAPHCILYYVNRKDPLGERPKDPSADPQFKLWEDAVSTWFEKNATSSSLISSTTPFSTSTLPTKTDNIHKKEYRPSIEILSPEDKAIITDKILRVKTKLSAQRGIFKVSYYINGILFAEKTSYPFDLNDNISFLGNGYHNLKVEACDDVGNCSNKSIVFNLKLPNNKFNKVGVSWVEPSNGIIVNKIDFPLNLKLHVTDYKKISKIDVIVYSPTSHTPTTLKTIHKFTSNNINIKWQFPTEPGVYKIIANVQIWDNTITKTKELIITLN